MKFVDSSSPLGSEFDKFLFAPLGEDENGLPLSVVSLLARMDLDPWQEAGELAALPADAAARRLAGSLDTLSDPILRRRITEPMVLRLLALLPRQTSAAVHTPAAAGIPAPRAGTRLGAVILIISAIVLLLSRIFAPHGYAPEVVPAPSVHPSPSQPLPTGPQRRD